MATGNKQLNPETWAGKYKPGALSKEEYNKVVSLLSTHSDEQIAEIIGRNPPVITNVRNKHAKKTVQSAHKDSIVLLHAKHYWKSKSAQLTRDEISYFEQEWAAYYKQFHDPVHTDEDTICDAIMIGIQLNRILAENVLLLNNISDTNKMIEDEQNKGENRDRILLKDLRVSLIALQAAQQTIEKRSLEMRDAKDKKLKILKATREQRFKRIEESKKNVFELLKELDEQDMRERENRMLSLVVDATNNEKNRLMSPITYADGTIDSVVFNSDTIEFLKKQEEEENNE